MYNKDAEEAGPSSPGCAAIEHIPKRVKIEFVYFIVLWLNAFPVRMGILSKYSPRVGEMEIGLQKALPGPTQDLL